MKVTVKNEYKIVSDDGLHISILELLRADEVYVKDCGRNVFLISTTDNKYFFKVELFSHNRFFYKRVLHFFHKRLPTLYYEDSELNAFAKYIVGLYHKEIRKIEEEKNKIRRENF